MQAPLLAVEEIKRLTTELRMPGIQIGSHIGDWNLDSRLLDPVWKVRSGTSGTGTWTPGNWTPSGR